MLTSTRAIVLHSLRYGDSSLIVSLLTEKLGRLDAMVRTPRNRKGAIKKQLFQPTMQIEVELDFRDHANLQHLRSARMATPYTDLPFNPAKLPQALFCAEFLNYATRGETDCQPLFLYAADSLQWLDRAGEGTANFHLVFMLRLSRFVGFYPNEEDYHEGCWFDLREGLFTASHPLHTDVLEPHEASLLATLLRLDYQHMGLLRLGRAERNDITDRIITFYRLHLPQMPELKSLAVLKEISPGRTTLPK